MTAPLSQEPTPDQAATLRVHLLGGFRVTVGGRVVDEPAWRVRKARNVVQLLALAPQHRLHREQVMELLWPEAGPEAATNSLRQTLHLARRALEPDLPAGRPSAYLRLRGELLGLQAPVDVWVDVGAFEAAAATARRTRDPADYQTALALYAGDLLPEEPYEDWAAERREALRATCLALLAELAWAQEARGEYGAAIEALARVVAAEPTHEEAHAGLMRLYALAGQRHRAVRQYQQLADALRRELDAEPDAASQRLYQEILAGRYPGGEPQPVALSPAMPTVMPTSAPRHNLPVQLTTFVGREREIAEVGGLLAGARLLTLTGAGGSGKTRLALEVAAGLVDCYPNGVWLVELAGLADPAVVPQAIASVLGLREEAGRPLTAILVDALRHKDLLLVLDNCEHLLDACAGLADTLLRACPRLRILATSREALHIGGEMTWRVPSLTLPDQQQLSSFECVAESEAVRLFVERARASRPSFALSDQNAATVARICRRLDGLPLALELAAARVGMFSVGQILARLDQSVRLLVGGSRTAPSRQQTLRATLDWGYRLLDEREQRLLRRLAVFTGGFVFEAAEAVTSDGPEPDEGRATSGEQRADSARPSPHGPRPTAHGPLVARRSSLVAQEDVLDLLTSLIDKSLVQVEEPGGEARYRLLETLREYALERLEASGEGGAIRRRHASYYLTLAVQTEYGPEQITWLARLQQEHDNLRAALRWLLDEGEGEGEGGLRLVGALAPFWSLRGYWSEGRQWVEAALAQSAHAPAHLRATVLIHAGRLALDQGDSAQASALFHEGLALFRPGGDKRGIAWALYGLATAARNQGDLTSARTRFEEVVALFRKLGDKESIGAALASLASVAMYQADYRWATTFLEESLALHRERRNRLGIAGALNNLGWVTLSQGEYSRAGTLFGQSLTLYRELEHRQGIANELNALGFAATRQGDYVQASALLQESLALFRELGNKRGIAAALNSLSLLAILQGDYALATALLDESLALGRETGHQGHVALALDRQGMVACCQGDYARAAKLYEASLALRREQGDGEGTAAALHGLGTVARHQGDHARARTLLDESLAMYREQGDRGGVSGGSSGVLGSLGLLALDQGDYARAAACFAESLAVRSELGDKRGIAICLEGLAAVAGARGQPARAARLYGAAAALRERIGAPLPPGDRPGHQRHLAAARARLDEGAWATAWAEGWTTPLEEAVAGALTAAEPPSDCAGAASCTAATPPSSAPGK